MTHTDEALVERLRTLITSVLHVRGLGPDSRPHANALVEAILPIIKAHEAETIERAAIKDIAAERARQIADEGWSPEHDDDHADGSLARAAACYAVGRHIEESTGHIDRMHRPISRPLWPWDEDWWKPSDDRRRQLIKAGALIAAEIERLDRATIRNLTKEQQS